MYPRRTVESVAKTYDEIGAKLGAWITAQPVFFVATAPLAAVGHVNVSPRGKDCLSLLGPRTLGWVDYAGSGAETIAHLRENARITMMWCAFEGPPRIVRVHGRGQVHLPGSPGFEDVAARHPRTDNTRAVLTVEALRISDACGYGVPLMDLVGERDQMERWTAAKGPAGVATYLADRNAVSLGGLPALEP